MVPSSNGQCVAIRATVSLMRAKRAPSFSSFEAWLKAAPPTASAWKQAAIDVHDTLECAVLISRDLFGTDARALEIFDRLMRRERALAEDEKGDDD